MKSKFVKAVCVAIVALCIMSISVYSQNWKLGGNTDAIPPLDGLLTNSNFLGATQTANVQLGTGGVSHIFIGGTAFPNPGFVGIGNTFITPNFLLDINGGDININNPANGYRLGAGAASPFVLWYNNIPSNIYVGINAGGVGVITGNNTFVGNNTGAARVSRAFLSLAAYPVFNNYL